MTVAKMSVPSDARSQLMAEIRRGKLLGNKRSHSENSLQQFGEEDPVTPEKNETDPGVLNEAVKASNDEEVASMERARRRAMSQPGPISGSLLTATAARAARKRNIRNVMYAADPAKLESTERQIPRYLSPFDTDVTTSISERGSPLPYNGYRNFDSRSVGSYRLYASNNDPRGTATPRKRSVMTMDGQSIRSVDTQAPPPTSPEVKKKRTKDSMSLVFSCMYAILLVTLGLIIYVADSFIAINAAPIYNIILTSIGYLYMFYLLIDIGRYKNTALKNQKIKSQHLENIEDFFAVQESQIQSGNSTPRNQTSESRTLPLRALPPPMLIPLKHDYCFSHGRHSGGFYLKLGAAAFALGHMVHSILLITVQIAYYMDDAINNDDCVDKAQMALDFMFPLYCFVQLYFVFKYSNVVILKAQGLARFAFMHFIGSSLCFWLSAIVRETILSLQLYAQTVYGNGNTRSSEDYAIISSRNYFINISSLYNENCIGSRAINSIFENLSPYLYPFSVEFNILIVAVFYIIWRNVGNCDKDSDKDDDGTSSVSDDNTVCKIPTASEENDFSSNIIIHADCHASNRGLFAGLIVTVCTIAMLIIVFVFSSVDDGFLEIGYIINYCTKLFLHVTMLIGAVVAYNQIRQLDVNEHSISLLDDVLLFICLPAFFIETTFSMVATISILNVVKTIDFILMVIQVFIQTALICDALRRCSNSRKLRRKKPGREIIMFLLIVNVAMWLFHTFSYKSPESLDERYAYYGKVLWTILGHISLPLMMFYRFHSSVCFADIWDSAFKPGSEH